jgi:hypothetical protein
MNPFGLRRPHVRDARAASKKTAGSPLRAAPFNSTGQSQLMIAGMPLDMGNLRKLPPAFTRVQCNNMNFFSSSRKVFAPL